MGGGVLRTAAKVAATGSLRSALIGEASRRAVRPPTSSFVPAVEPGHSVPSLSAGPTPTESPAVVVEARWPEWEVDEWELAGDKEKSLESVDVAPRLVFGPVPTIEEAKAATTDLKDALEKEYFTPEHTLGSHGGGVATTYGGNGAVSAVPKHVAQMFSLLKGSSEAQEVVASLAADKNVWDAVMKNEKVLQFCKSPSPEVIQVYEEPAEHVAGSKADFSAAMEEKKSSGGSFVRDLLGNLKAKVSEAVGNISEYVQAIFGISSGDEATSGTDDNNTNLTLKFSFMGLAVAVILVILFKRA